MFLHLLQYLCINFKLVKIPLTTNTIFVYAITDKVERATTMLSYAFTKCIDSSAVWTVTRTAAHWRRILSASREIRRQEKPGIWNPCWTHTDEARNCRRKQDARNRAMFSLLQLYLHTLGSKCAENLYEALQFCPGCESFGARSENGVLTKALLPWIRRDALQQWETNGPDIGTTPNERPDGPDIGTIPNRYQRGRKSRRTVSPH